MIRPKKVKAARPHICVSCGKTIQPGEYVNFFERREPKLDKDYFQIGINYFRAWFHLPPGEDELDCVALAELEKKQNEQ